jgi:hypothetical protein
MTISASFWRFVQRSCKPRLEGPIEFVVMELISQRTEVLPTGLALIVLSKLTTAKSTIRTTSSKIMCQPNAQPHNKFEGRMEANWNQKGNLIPALPVSLSACHCFAVYCSGPSRKGNVGVVVYRFHRVNRLCFPCCDKE